MKRISEKRRGIYEVTGEWREALVKEVGHCEWCGGQCGRLEVHEISRGSSRLPSLMERACVLVLGRLCHDALHRCSDNRHIGLAILFARRRTDYNLSRFWEITSRRFPEQSEIDTWVKRLSLKNLSAKASAATSKTS